MSHSEISQNPQITASAANQTIRGSVQISIPKHHHVPMPYKLYEILTYLSQNQAAILSVKVNQTQIDDIISTQKWITYYTQIKLICVGDRLINFSLAISVNMLLKFNSLLPKQRLAPLFQNKETVEVIKPGLTLLDTKLKLNLNLVFFTSRQFKRVMSYF